MSRWFTIGHETAPRTADSFLTFEGTAFVGAAASVSKDTTTFRSGAASRAHNSGASNALAYTRVAWGIQGANGYFVRAYMRFSALPSSTVRVMFLEDSAFAAIVGARLTSGGKLQLWNETGTPAQIGSDSAATIAAGAWYRIELYGKTVTGASDASELRLDGTTVASQTGASYSDNNLYSVLFGWLTEPAASKILNVEDMAVNDDLGASNNSWPGEGKIVYLDALSDNARDTHWTAGAGATTNLWDAVNADPPAGVAAASATDTSQIKNVNAADATGNYDANMESYTTAGLVSTDTITLVQAVSLGGSSAGSISGALKIVSNPVQTGENTNSYAGGAIGSYGSGWSAHWGTAQNSPSVTLATQPVLRIGKRTASATELHFCGMRVAVEYTSVASTSSLLLLGA